jgi:hypothetical protein
MDCFRDADKLIGDPYPYFEELRTKCPGLREEHHGVTMVTGCQEPVDISNDASAFSSCISMTGPLPGLVNDRRYTCIPTYILRRLTELHVELRPVVGASR